MKRISREEQMMNYALVARYRSSCSRNQVGCIIAKDSRVVSTGYNGAPKGLPHCTHKNDSPCEDSVHAEANAIIFAAKEGISTDGASLYTTLSPCVKCSQLIINAGISRVYYSDEYRITDGIKLLNRAGIRVTLVRL